MQHRRDADATSSRDAHVQLPYAPPEPRWELEVRSSKSEDPETGR